MTYNIYVDGSWNSKENQEYSGWGFIILNTKNDILYSDMGKIKHESTRQIAGELEAVIKSLEYCISNKILDVIIYYDYIGIEKWITKEWQAKKPLTQSYIKRFPNKNNINVKFCKIKSHSNNKFNDLADKLAKDGLKK